MRAWTGAATQRHLGAQCCDTERAAWPGAFPLHQMRHTEGPADCPRLRHLHDGMPFGEVAGGEQADAAGRV